MKRSADWLAWALQLIVGLGVGAFVGLQIISRGSWVVAGYTATPCLLLAIEEVPTFLWGAAFIGGAMASCFGDRLWIGLSYRLIPPEAPQQSNASRFASLGIGVLGCLLILLAVYHNFHPYFALPL